MKTIVFLLALGCFLCGAMSANIYWQEFRVPQIRDKDMAECSKQAEKTANRILICKQIEMQYEELLFKYDKLKISKQEKGD
jgi:hypothetical protein